MFLFFLVVCLFGCAGLELQHMGSELLQHAGCSSPDLGWNLDPYIRAQSLRHFGLGKSTQ